MRFIRNLLFKNITLKLAAVVSAFAIWMYADSKTSATVFVDIRTQSNKVTHRAKIHATHDALRYLKDGLVLDSNISPSQIDATLIKKITGQRCVVLDVQEAKTE